MEKITYRVEELGTVVGGGTPSTQTTEYWDGNIPWISPADLTGYTNVYISKGAKSITEEGLKKSSTKLLPQGTVLLSSRAPIGYLAIAQNDICTNQGFKSIICKNNIVNNKYLYYFLKLNVEHLKAFASGATFPELSGNRLKRIKLNIAKDVEVQKQIADVLSTYDELIENNNKRITILEQMAENLYKEWFVNYRFAGHEKSLFENNIPVGWEKVTLDSILSKIATGLNPRKNFVLGEGDNYYVTIKNMGDNNIYLDEKCDKVTDEAIRKINNRSDLRQGDLLFSGIGTIGRVYLINIPTDNWNISESVFTMRPNEKVSSEYLYLLLLSNDVQNYCQSNANGAAQKGIRMADLKKYAFWLAPQSILDEFTNIVKPIIEQVDLIRKSNVNLIKQRDLLLPRLMSGKLEV